MKDELAQSQQFTDEKTQSGVASDFVRTTKEVGSSAVTDLPSLLDLPEARVYEHLRK
jgi:hypothetical protein